MTNLPIYMDDHSTTRVDPRVVDAMLPYLSATFGNPSSVNHSFGWDAQQAVHECRQSIAASINAQPKDILFTGGATESNNLALRGVCLRNRKKGKHVISVLTEHHAILDPLDRLMRRDEFDVTLLPVANHDNATIGTIDLDQLRDAIRPDTILVSVMFANNEIGTIQPITEIGSICREHNILFHTDATQAVGRIPIDVDAMHIDLMSFSAHKFYGPKGVGGLYVRRDGPRPKLLPLVDGGGQENGLRAGTLNTAGIVAMRCALELSTSEQETEALRLSELRNELYAQLTSNIPNLLLNGPALDNVRHRLSNNLNICFGDVDGEALMMSTPDLAISSGSACSSTNPEPSHVLLAIGRSDDETRASLRFGLGRFTTPADVDAAAQLLTNSIQRLRSLR
ncbi:MAG: cysteine desulfurase family protein [Planctomycetota bacterium]|nr:cysteine desulfurase family protein [Planctomycetota bacterium]